MATQIGVVKALIGNVTATATDGSTRTLQVGDNVYANELITTNIAAAIEIELNDGSVMDLGRSSQVMLDNAVFDPSATTTVASETDDVPDDIAAIQAALLAGDDPTEVGDATAAGAGVVTGNEGHAPVFVDYLNPTVRPEAGFDTIGVFNEYDLPEEDIIILDEEDGSPTTGNTEVFVDEDDLGGDIQVSFVGPSAIITAFGTDTGYFTTFPFKFGNNDEEPGDDLPPNSSTTQTGQLNASFGSDGAGSVGFQAEAAQPSGLTSGGQPVLFWVSADGSMLVGYTLTSDDYYSDYDFVRIDQNYEFQPYGVAEIIFTAEIPDSGTTDYAFTLHGPLDHAPGEAENNLFIDLAYTITDSDGDAASGVLRVNVDDDVPVRAEGDEEQAQIIAQVHEEGMSTSLGDAGDLSEGNRDGGSLTDDETSSHIAGSLHYVVSVGADAPATFSLIDDSATLNELLPGLYSKGESVSYSVSGDSDVSVLTAMAGDRVVFTMTVHSNGNWYFDLDDQLDHAPGDGENFTLLTGDGGYDISTVGSIDFTKILKVTDADGDELVWTDDDVDVFAVQVQDDVPTLVSVSGEFNPVTALVAEDALSTAVEATDSSEGILDAGQDNSDDEASGVAGDLSSLIVVNDGADEPVSVTFSLQADTSGLSTLYSNGEAVSYSVDGNVLTAMAGGTIIFTLTVNADGSWAFDLDDQLDHVDTDSDTTTALRTSLDGSTSVDAIDFSSIVTVSVEDFDGDVATLNGLNAGLFTISVQNDVPVANNETPIALTEGDAAINGNVLANDVPGADEPITLTQVDLGDGFVDITTGTDLGSGNYGFSIDGVGDYSFNANGNWTFEPADSVNNTEGDVDASFSYRIEDADGDNAEAMQPISIADGQDPLAGEPITLSLDDQNLADGSTPAVDDFDTGSIVFTPGSDPIASIVFSMDLSGLDASMTWERVSDNQIIGRDGVDDIVTLDLGVVGDTATITATLNDNYDSHPTINVDDLKALGSVGVVATDIDGDFATGIVNVEVSDDLPTANDDGPETVTEDATSFVSGNVLDNDDANADQAAAFVGWSGADAATIATLNSFGTLVQNGDGSWSYTLDNSLATTQALTAADTMNYVLNYTMADADGDEDTATLTITIKGADDDATVETAQAEGPDATVYEAGLNPDGSDAASDSETVTGSFDVSASDGILTVVIGGTTFTLAEVQAFDGSDSVTTGEGTLTLTGYTGDAMSGTIAYSYTLDGTIDNDSIVPSGDDAVTLAHFDDSVEISVNGLGGTTASDDLVIRAVDDTPTANDDGPETVTEDATSFVSGNVLDNDDANADQAAAFVGWSGADAATIATLNSFGTLVQNGDGSWSYTLDNSLATTQALTAADTMNYVLNYTMADADGDEDTATLTITIKGADDDATVETAQAEGPDATVYEAGLNPDGSDAASDSETVTGSFDVSASDGILTVVIGGTTFTLAEVQAFDGSDSVTTGEGTLTLTGYTGDAMSGTIAYSYTLDGTIDNDSIVPSGDDAVTLAHFDDSVEISVNGLGGTTASDDLVIRAIDDVPAAEDYIGGSYAEGSSNNVVAADAASTLGIAGGADGLNSTLQAISFTGGQGSLFINGSGQLIYTPPANVVNPGGAPVSDVFSYTVTDNDGDFVTKQVTVGITDTGVTELSASNALVDEDDLPMGNDDSATGDDNPIGSGTISYTVGTDGFDSVSLSTTGDTTGLMTHDGDAVDTIWDSGSNTLIGYVAGTDSTDAANQVFTVTLTNINASGADYDVTLLQAVKHPDADNENNVDFTVNVSVLDNDGSEGITNFNVSIDDDVPVASPEENSGEATLEVNTNVMMILDVSGSMNDSANFQGMTRLQVMIKSSLELLDQYDAYGDVMVNIITFATSASNPSGGWVTVDQAKTIILGLTAGGNTNYDDALNDAINAFALGGKLGDGQNISYFMSDGEPNSNNVSNSATVPDGNNNLGGGSGIDSDEEDDWIDFLELNNINSFSLGMGTGVDEDELDPIAYDGVEEVDTDSIVVSDFADLQATLIGTIDVPPLSGNLIDGGAGADEGWIYSVTVGGVNYIYDQPNDNQSVSGGASNGSFDDTTNVWTITTPEGGTLSVDMDTGDYEYFGPDVVLSEVQEVFTFTISDYDGDMDSSTLTVTIDPAAGPMIVRDDFVLTNQDPVDIPDWALLANDTGPDSGSQIVSAVFNADEGSVTDNADSVEFDDDDTDGGSFSYTNTAGTRSDDGNVSVERQSGDTIQGDYLDEILVGGSGAETLDGGAGDDILIGGNGATGGLTQRISITADGEGNSSNNNFLQFAYLIGSLGVYVESISIDLRAGTDTNASFDDDWGPDYSNLSGLNPGDITSTVLSGSGDSVMTINFANNSFTNGGSFDLNIDIDNLSGDDGDDFGEAGVTATVTFSNGEVHNLVFEQVDGNTSIAQTLVADDVLIGGEGNDILQGGGGNDLLTGGDGDDIFLWKAGDDGTDITPAMDIVTDFNAGDDVLDIADLLQGEESSIDLTEYMNVTESGSNVVIEVTPSGSGNHTQVITMQNTSLSDLGANPADSQADIISSLISQGHIHVDQS
ncbi:hypothetical protein LP43_0596 [Methylophaga thiooxydans]|uniref:VWFA domain-containing protein n=1 Tax=Methylophaga thiooxydans TaxID=392484 RepID=A0A0A0BI27_9GAMM|nr:retention module-containing protein [Methylophaga thiooxydans]KGM08173.1 hypothetical protein LP43_0596 [Methylophaga thiooxydans]